MKKFVIKLDLHDNKDKQKALKAVSSIPGIDSIAMDMNEQKLTVIGSVDPVTLVSKLRKFWRTEIFSVGPVKEPEKKEEAKKEEMKKEEPKKDEAKKDETKKDGEQNEKKKEETEKKIDPQEQLYQYYQDMIRYRGYNAHMNNNTHYYHVQSAEENPNACVIV